MSVKITQEETLCVVLRAYACGERFHKVQWTHLKRGKEHSSAEYTGYAKEKCSGVILCCKIGNKLKEQWAVIARWKQLAVQGDKLLPGFGTGSSLSWNIQMPAVVFGSEGGNMIADTLWFCKLSGISRSSLLAEHTDFCFVLHTTTPHWSRLSRRWRTSSAHYESNCLKVHDTLAELL